MGKRPTLVFPDFDRTLYRNTWSRFRRRRTDPTRGNGRSAWASRERSPPPNGVRRPSPRGRGERGPFPRAPAKRPLQRPGDQVVALRVNLRCLPLEPAAQHQVARQSASAGAGTRSHADQSARPPRRSGNRRLRAGLSPPFGRIPSLSDPTLRLSRRSPRTGSGGGRKARSATRAFPSS